RRALGGAHLAASRPDREPAPDLRPERRPAPRAPGRGRARRPPPRRNVSGGDRAGARPRRTPAAPALRGPPPAAPARPGPGRTAAEWIEQRLSEQGLRAEDVLRLDQQEQAAAHVTVRHLISSMRLITALDWNEFFESVSLVEEVLCRGTRVGEMDFPTRDRY